MRFGVNTWVWVSPFSDEHVNLVAKISEMGFDSMEIAAEDWSIIHTGKIRQALEQHNLEVTVCGAFGPHRDLIHDDEEIRQNAATYIEECIRETANLGGRVFAGPIYSAVGKARLVDDEQKKRERERFITGITPLVAMAEDLGVTLGLEPLNRFETDFINIAEQAIHLVDLVDHPNLGILLDTFHMSIEEKSMAAAIRAVGSRLVHMHVCENDRGTPGSGQVPWTEVTGALREIGYDGHLTIESFTPGVVEIAKAAAIWRPLAKSQDALAMDGLKFLKGL